MKFHCLFKPSLSENSWNTYVFSVCNSIPDEISDHSYMCSQILSLKMSEKVVIPSFFPGTSGFFGTQLRCRMTTFFYFVFVSVILKKDPGWVFTYKKCYIHMTPPSSFVCWWLLFLFFCSRMSNGILLDKL